MKTCKQKFIYIMVSSTGTRFGRIIRYATKSSFNHVSISFDESMKQLYSFGRYCHCMPFIGGLVNETQDRFTLRRGAEVEIGVYKIPVSDNAFFKGLDRIAEIAADDEYAYNLLSAITFCVKGGTEHYKTYTCSEFVSHLLRLMRPDLAFGKADCKVLPDNFVEQLGAYEYYRGPLNGYGKFAESVDKRYFNKLRPRVRWSKTARFILGRYLNRRG